MSYSLSDIESSEEFQSYSPEEQDLIRSSYAEESGAEDIWNNIYSSDEFNSLDLDDQRVVASTFDSEYGTSFGQKYTAVEEPLPQEDVTSDYGALETTKDVGVSFVKGIAELPSVAGQQAGFLGDIDVPSWTTMLPFVGLPAAALKIASGIGEMAEEPLKKLGKKGSEYWEGKKSEEAKAIDKEGFLSDEEGKWFGDNAVKKVLFAAAESAPGMVPMAFGGAAISTGTKALKVAPKLTKALQAMGLNPKRAGKLAELAEGSLTYGTSESVYSGLQSAAQVGDQINETSHEELLKSPVYNELLKEYDGDKKKAKEGLIDQVEKATMIKTAGATFVGGAAGGGGVLGKIAGKGGKGFVRDAAGGLVQEAVQEAGQSGLENIAQNVVTRDYLDPSQTDITKGTGEAMALGGATGGLLGLAGGGLTPKTKPMDIMAAKTVDEAFDKFAQSTEVDPITLGQEIPKYTAAEQAYDDMQGQMLEGNASWLSKEAIEEFGGGIDLTQEEASIILEKKKAGIPLTSGQEEKGKYIDTIANSFVQPQLKRTEEVYDDPIQPVRDQVEAETAPQDTGRITETGTAEIQPVEEGQESDRREPVSGKPVALTEEEHDTLAFLSKATHRIVPSEEKKAAYQGLVAKGLAETDGESYATRKETEEPQVQQDMEPSKPDTDKPIQQEVPEPEKKITEEDKVDEGIEEKPVINRDVAGQAAKQIDESPVDATIKYDGQQKIAGQEFSQFTIQSGPAKGATLNVESLEDLPKTVADKVKAFSPKVMRGIPLITTDKGAISEDNQPAVLPKKEDKAPPQSFSEEPHGIKSIRDSLASKNIDNYITERDDSIHISKIVVPKKDRGSGVGTQAIKDITEYADSVGKTITLSPSKDFGATSVGRLKTFYKKHGFVENKGKNKDYQISESMYRPALRPRPVATKDEAMAKFKEKDDSLGIKETDKRVALFSKAPRTKGYQKTEEGLLIGYKVMAVDENGSLVSGANSRLTFSGKVGETISMPGDGVFVSNKPEYVVDYYSGLADNEILLKVEFDEKDVKFGRSAMNDNEPETGVSKVRVIDKVNAEEYSRQSMPLFSMTGQSKTTKPQSKVKQQYEKLGTEEYIKKYGSKELKQSYFLLRELLPKNTLQSVQVEVKSETNTSGVVGTYIPADKLVQMYDNTTTGPVSEEGFAATLLHEIIHGITYEKLQYDPEISTELDKLRDKVAWQLLTDPEYENYTKFKGDPWAFNEYVENGRKSDKSYQDMGFEGQPKARLVYMLLSNDEFLANATHPEMQKALSGVNVETQQKFMARIKDIMMRLFGWTRKQYNAYDQAMSAIVRLNAEIEFKLEDYTKAKNYNSVNSFAQPNDISQSKAEDKIQNLPAFKKWFGNSKVVNEDGDPLVVYHGTAKKFSSFDPRESGTSGVPRTGNTDAVFFTDSEKEAARYMGMSYDVKSWYESREKYQKKYDSISGEIDNRKGEKWAEERDKYRQKGKSMKEAVALANASSGISAEDVEKMKKYRKLANEQLPRSGVAISNRRVVKAFVRIERPLIYNASGRVTTNSATVKKLIQQARRDGSDGLILENTRSFNEDDTPTRHFVLLSPNQIKSIFNTKWNPEKDNILESFVEFKETQQPITPEDYKENRAQEKGIKEKFLRGARSVLDEIKGGMDKFLGAISTRLGNINEKLKFKMRRLEFDIGTKQREYMEKVQPLLEKSKKMSGRDLADWDYARKNSDRGKILELVNKYDMLTEYEAYREALDLLRQEALDVGYDIGLIEEYAPRVLKDSKGFLKAMGKEENWPVISRRLNERANELGITVADMTPEMKADMIANMLFGGPMGKSAPGATKMRKIDKIPPKLNKYYMDSNAALVSHIHGMVKAIEARKFFGKVPENISKAKRAKHTAESSLRKNLSLLAEKNAVGEDTKTLETKIANIQSNIKEYQKKLDGFRFQRDFTNTIAGYVGELIQSKEISGKDEQDLIDILNARFTEKGTHGLVQAYKNASYIDTMGSPISAMTQLGDQAWSWYEHGAISALKHSGKALVGKSKITKEDAGIERIAQEFADPGTLANAVSWVFKKVQLERMDTIGKESMLNGALEKYQKRAKEDAKALRKELEPMFEGEADSVLDDLLSGEITENVKFLTYSKLLDFQPAALSEMPEQYLRAGNGRIFYMLKTFTLKQFDIFRRISYNKIRSGNPKEVKEGLQNLIKMGVIFVLANAGADEIKDWMLGRKTDLNDRVVDNVLRLFGVSKFITWQARTEGLPTALFKQMHPPFKFANALYKDIRTRGDEKGLETLSSVPIVGKLAYWHMGRGTEKRGDLWDVRLRKEKKKLNDIKDRVERHPSERPQYKKELNRLVRANQLQGKLNKLRSQINKYKTKDTKSSKRQIQRLESRRNDLIKQFLRSKR